MVTTNVHKLRATIAIIVLMMMAHFNAQITAPQKLQKVIPQKIASNIRPATITVSAAATTGAGITATAPQIASMIEYVIVAQDEPVCERYVRQADGSWALVSFVGLTATLEFTSIKTSVPLADVYAGTAGLGNKPAPIAAEMFLNVTRCFFRLPPRKKLDELGVFVQGALSVRFLVKHSHQACPRNKLLQDVCENNVSVEARD